MLGFVSRLVGGAVSPLLDQAATFGAGLLRKLALFLVAAISMTVVAVALTLAFAFWISSLSSPVVGALAVAGLYLGIAVAAVGLALRTKRGPVVTKTENAEAQASAAEESDRVDQFTAPLLSILASLGLRREQLAVLAGASLAKRLRPLSLVGVAIVAGFLVGRLWQGWNALFPSELVDAVADLVSARSRSASQDDATERAGDVP